MTEYTLVERSFLAKHQGWVAEQLERVERLRVVRAPRRERAGEILLRGSATPVRIESVPGRRGPNRVLYDGAVVRIEQSASSRTSAARSLENWLRKQARVAITKELDAVTRKLRRSPNRIYVMGQRTKWGNCSALHNLSFTIGH